MKPITLLPIPGREKGLFHIVFSALLAVAAAAVMMFAIPQASAAFKYVQVGSEVPDFSLTALDGREVSLVKLKEAKFSIVLFWATWSPRSIEEMKDLEKLYQEYKDKGLEVVGINVNHLTYTFEDRKAIDKVIADTAVTFPIALDKGLETYNTMGVVATPSTILMDQSGKITYEISSYLTFTGEKIRENTEIALGLREAVEEVVVAEEDKGYKPTRKAMLYYNLGRNLLKRGDRDKAIDKLSMSVEEDSGYAAPRILLGHLYLENSSDDDQDALDGAISLFQEAIKQEPKNISALTGLGEGFLRKGKLDEAESLLKEAIEVDATYTPAITGLATIYSEQGRYEESLVKFKEALELNPFSPNVYFRRALSYEAQGMLKEAAGDLRRAVEILLGYGLTDGEA